MHSDASINKKLWTYYGELQQIKKKYGYSDELISVLTLIWLSFNDMYNNIDDLYYKLVNNTEIIMSKGEMSTLAKKYNVEVNERVLGLIMNANPKNLFEDNTYVPNDKILIAGSHNGKRLEKVLVLDSLIHEMRHGLTKILNNNMYIKDDIYFTRTGLIENFYVLKNDNIYCTKYGTCIEELFNSYFTESLVNIIKKYKYNTIDNQNIKRFLKELKLEPYYTSAYQTLFSACSLFFYNKDIVYMANNAGITGKTEDFKNLFDDYYEFANELDQFYYDTVNDNFKNDEYFDKLYKIKRKTKEITKKRIK